MATSKLKPRSTVLNENEQLVRLKPNANTTDVSADGIVNEHWLSPVATNLEETVTHVRAVPRMNALPAVSETGGSGNRPDAGEQMGNITFTLQGGATPLERA